MEGQWKKEEEEKKDKTIKLDSEFQNYKIRHPLAILDFLTVWIKIRSTSKIEHSCYRTFVHDLA